jgi:hypothetical protein
MRKLPESRPIDGAEGTVDDSCWEARRSRAFPTRTALVFLVWALVPLSVFTGSQPCSIAAHFHRPCPGCGLTRATLLLFHGDVHGSLAMHPLAVPVIASWGAVALATLVATWREGEPWHFYRARFGKIAVIATSVVYVALFVLWALREHGFFGGRVPVG